MTDRKKKEALSREKAPDYVTYSRKFKGYRWYKPLLEVFLAAIVWTVGTVLFIVLAVLIANAEGADGLQYFESLGGGYDHFDNYTLQGALMQLGGLACIIPGTMIAVKIARSRPFHSVSSSCGGFSFRIFARVLLPALAIIGIPAALDTVITTGSRGAVQFTLAGFLACLILTPLQCAGEEYMFRGLALQGIGSWVKIPVLAVLLQALPFALLHPYGIFGKTEVLLSGILMGFMACYTKGLEASTAAHFANNIAVFILNGLGFNNISANGSSLKDVILVALLNTAYLAFIIYMDRKHGWLERIPGDTDILENI